MSRKTDQFRSRINTLSDSLFAKAATGIAKGDFSLYPAVRRLMGWAQDIFDIASPAQCAALEQHIADLICSVISSPSESAHELKDFVELLYPLFSLSPKVRAEIGILVKLASRSYPEISNYADARELGLLILLDKGADLAGVHATDDVIDFINNAKWNSMTVEQRRVLIEAIKAIKVQSPEVFERTQGGDTLLMKIVDHPKSSFSLELFQAVLAKTPDECLDATLSEADVDPSTALARAIKRGNYAAAQMLLDRGADPWKQDNDGETALDQMLSRKLNDPSGIAVLKTLAGRLRAVADVNPEEFEEAVESALTMVISDLSGEGLRAVLGGICVASGRRNARGGAGKDQAGMPGPAGFGARCAGLQEEFGEEGGVPERAV